MNPLRKSMDLALKEQVVPVLRQAGFRGSMPHFRQTLTSEVVLLTFQFDKWGGGFVVEAAECPVEGLEGRDGQRIPPNKVTAHHISPGRRRLAPAGMGEGFWYRFDPPSDPRKAIYLLLPVLRAQFAKWGLDEGSPATGAPDAK